MWLDTVKLGLAHITAAPSYQDSGWIFWATCVVILLLFLWGRLASYVNGQTGRVTAVPESKGCRPEPASVPVELWSGRTIHAQIDGCMLCSLNLVPGDKVWVTQNADGYVIIRAKGLSLKSLLRDTMVESAHDCLAKRGT